jgi:hypothetical protein
MKNVAWWFSILFLTVGCGVQRHAEQSSALSFSDVYLTSDANFSAGTNLCIVIDHRPAGGAEALDSLIAKHAQAAILEARKVATPFRKVVFLIKDKPNSQYCVSAGFTVSQLEEIVKNAADGKAFDSLQSWPGSKLPAKQ